MTKSWQKRDKKRDKKLTKNVKKVGHLEEFILCTFFPPHRHKLVNDNYYHVRYSRCCKGFLTTLTVSRFY